MKVIVGLCGPDSQEFLTQVYVFRIRVNAASKAMLVPSAVAVVGVIFVAANILFLARCKLHRDFNLDMVHGPFDMKRFMEHLCSLVEKFDKIGDTTGILECLGLFFPARRKGVWSMAD